VIWEGAAGPCEPHSRARDLSELLGYSRVGAAVLGVVLALVVLRRARGLGWWVAATAVWVLLWLASALQFADQCAA
jgi:hypothetical protein